MPKDVGVHRANRGTALHMKLLRTASAIGVAKTVFDQARKPENQVRIKNAVSALRGTDSSKESKARRKAKSRRRR
jgi:deoxyinosine 3'endonuclease (endonuclease V)